MARVLQVHPGNDGLVRVATVKQDSVFKRPVHNFHISELKFRMGVECEHLLRFLLGKFAAVNPVFQGLIFDNKVPSLLKNCLVICS
ncbi:hypothetical protein TNCV_4249731 [Trichonephila clavipes]|nr:hypothetical protein TNCV_4249731 [Trichonephila clavipes]